MSGSRMVDTAGIVKAAEDALLGRLEYADDHPLLQVGVVFEALYHEAADEGCHLAVIPPKVGGHHGSVVLVQQNVGWLAVGSL